MKFIKHVGLFALVASTLTFTGCTQDQANLVDDRSQANGYGQPNQANLVDDRSQANGYGQPDYQNNRTNNRTDSRLYRLGKEDGCNSAKGIVTPGIRNGNEVTYKDSQDYTDGFRKGMKSCAKR